MPLTKEEQIQAIYDLKVGYKLGHADIAMLKSMARQFLAALESRACAEPARNPVLAYADSYRDMARQGVKSIPVWSVITDLERNIAPLYTRPQPTPVVLEGYALVPVEPTQEMLTASYMFARVDNTVDSWKAMLAAAPRPDVK